LAEAIELAAQDSDTTKVIAVCARIIKATGLFDGQKEQFQASNPVDTLVLGCTHYPFAARHLSALVGSSVQLLDTGQAVARQARRMLGSVLAAQPPARAVELVSTGNPNALRAAAGTWLGLRGDIQMLQI
jgi:glutamate racemase